MSIRTLFCGNGLAVRYAAIAALAASCWTSAVNAQEAPDKTVADLKTADGLEITLWAAEPQLVNPTDMDIDERGRVWITEAANYRGSKTRPEGDRIIILEDTDQDGKADSSKVFWQDPSLFAPLGICKVGNKLYVSQSPNILVFTIDESGDKPVGKPEVVLTGWTGENHDHGVHAMTFGPDGRFYFNSGNEGTKGIVKDGKGNPVTDVLGSSIGAQGKQWRGKERPKGKLGYTQGMAFRMNPDLSGLEVLGYNFRNNYEVAVDSFGTAWQSDNDDDGNQGVRINYVMEGGNFGFVGPKGTGWQRDQNLYPDQSKQEAHWHLRWPGVVPNMLHTGGGSPTGILVYEGDLLGERYRGALIHCDAGPNVVRAYFPQSSSDAPKAIFELNKKPENHPGAGYAAEAVELVKGKDRWFRPADVCAAPDGSLLIADWYDPGVGGHATGDKPNNGGLRGRVYRVAPKGNKPAKPSLDLASTKGQIAALESPNLATRYLGYQALVSDPKATGALTEIFKSDKKPQNRARAMWLLARQSGGDEVVKTALKDSDENIRIAAIRAARIIKQDIPAIADKMLDDKSPGVLRELALAMNYEPDEKAIPVLVKLADKYDGKDRWYLEAIGIGATGREEALLTAWQKDGKNKDDAVGKGLTWRLTPADAPAKTASAGGAGPFARTPEAAR